MSIATSSLKSAARPLPAAALETVGSWELLQCLAQGQLAEVFAARPLGSPGPARYALKRLRAVWRDTPEALAALICEAQVLSEVSHPHLAPLLAVELRGETKHLVFPLLEGAPSLPPPRGGVARPLPETLWIARQAAEGLAALHEAGWLHGDLKPEHVLVSDEGHATLIDFGFARPLGAASATHAVRGTPRYLAPECLVSTLRVDQRSDLYSLGAMLFHWLAGRAPFDAATHADLARQHRQELPVDLRALVPSLPTGVVVLVRELLAKSPERRPQSAREVIERLWPLEIDAFAEWDQAL